MLESVLLLFLILGTQTGFSAIPPIPNFCDGVLKIKEKTFVKVSDIAPFYVIQNEDPFNDCVLLIHTTGSKNSRPHYIRFTFKELGLKENPMQIKARARKAKWETKAFYANVHMSKTKVVVDTRENDFIKLVTPRANTPDFSVKIEPVFLSETTKIPKNLYPLLGQCGLSLHQVKINQCFEDLKGLSCTFECKKGYFPLFIDEAIYPAFTGSCETGKTVNWPQEGSNLCVSQYAVVGDCMGSVDETTYFGLLGNCPYYKNAVMTWFGEIELKPNISFSSVMEKTKRCPSGCYSLPRREWSPDREISPCATECVSTTINGVTSYTPKCWVAPDWRKCMSCRYPELSSPCRLMRVTGKK